MVLWEPKLFFYGIAVKKKLLTSTSIQQPGQYSQSRQNMKYQMLHSPYQFSGFNLNGLTFNNQKICLFNLIPKPLTI